MEKTPYEKTSRTGISSFSTDTGMVEGESHSSSKNLGLIYDVNVFTTLVNTEISSMRLGNVGPFAKRCVGCGLSLADWVAFRNSTFDATVIDKIMYASFMIEVLISNSSDSQSTFAPAKIVYEALARTSGIPDRISAETRLSAVVGLVKGFVARASKNISQMHDLHSDLMAYASKKDQNVFCYLRQYFLLCFSDVQLMCKIFPGYVGDPKILASIFSASFVVVLFPGVIELICDDFVARQESAERRRSVLAQAGLSPAISSPQAQAEAKVCKIVKTEAPAALLAPSVGWNDLGTINRPDIAPTRSMSAWFLAKVLFQLNDARSVARLLRNNGSREIRRFTIDSLHFMTSVCPTELSGVLINAFPNTAVSFILYTAPMDSSAFYEGPLPSISVTNPYGGSAPSLLRFSSLTAPANRESIKLTENVLFSRSFVIPQRAGGSSNTHFFDFDVPMPISVSLMPGEGLVAAFSYHFSAMSAVYEEMCVGGTVDMQFTVQKIDDLQMYYSEGGLLVSYNRVSSAPARNDALDESPSPADDIDTSAGWNRLMHALNGNIDAASDVGSGNYHHPSTSLEDLCPHVIASNLSKILTQEALLAEEVSNSLPPSASHDEMAFYVKDCYDAAAAKSNWFSVLTYAMLLKYDGEEMSRFEPFDALVEDDDHFFDVSEDQDKTGSRQTLATRSSVAKAYNDTVGLRKHQKLKEEALSSGKPVNGMVSQVMNVKDQIKNSQAMRTRVVLKGKENHMWLIGYAYRHSLTRRQLSSICNAVFGPWNTARRPWSRAQCILHDMCEDVAIRWQTRWSVFLCDEKATNRVNEQFGISVFEEWVCATFGGILSEAKAISDGWLSARADNWNKEMHAKNGNPVYVADSKSEREWASDNDAVRSAHLPANSMLDLQLCELWQSSSDFPLASQNWYIASQRMVAAFVNPNYMNPVVTIPASFFQPRSYRFGNVNPANSTVRLKGVVWQVNADPEVNVLPSPVSAAIASTQGRLDGALKRAVVEPQTGYLTQSFLSVWSQTGMSWHPEDLVLKQLLFYYIAKQQYMSEIDSTIVSVGTEDEFVAMPTPGNFVNSLNASPIFGENMAINDFPFDDAAGGGSLSFWLADVDVTQTDTHVCFVPQDLMYLPTSTIPIGAIMACVGWFPCPFFLSNVGVATLNAAHIQRANQMYTSTFSTTIVPGVSSLAIILPRKPSSREWPDGQLRVNASAVQQVHWGPYAAAPLANTPIDISWGPVPGGGAGAINVINAVEFVYSWTGGAVGTPWTLNPNTILSYFTKQDQYFQTNRWMSICDDFVSLSARFAVPTYDNRAQHRFANTAVEKSKVTSPTGCALSVLSTANLPVDFTGSADFVCKSASLSAWNKLALQLVTLSDAETSSNGRISYPKLISLPPALSTKHWLAALHFKAARIAMVSDTMRAYFACPLYFYFSAYAPFPSNQSPHMYALVRKHFFDSFSSPTVYSKVGNALHSRMFSSGLCVSEGHTVLDRSLGWTNNNEQVYVKKDAANVVTPQVDLAVYFIPQRLSAIYYCMLCDWAPKYMLNPPPRQTPDGYDYSYLLRGLDVTTAAGVRVPFHPIAKDFYNFSGFSGVPSTFVRNHGEKNVRRMIHYFDALSSMCTVNQDLATMPGADVIPYSCPVSEYYANAGAAGPHGSRELPVYNLSDFNQLGEFLFTLPINTFNQINVTLFSHTGWRIDYFVLAPKDRTEARGVPFLSEPSGPLSDLFDTKKKTDSSTSEVTVPPGNAPPDSSEPVNS